MLNQRWLNPWWVKVGLFVAIWIAVFSIDFDYNRSRRLTDHFTLVERVHLERHPYAGMVESTGSFFLPFPGWQSKVLRKRLVADGRTIWESENAQWLDVTPSPNGERALVWSRNPQSAWRILERSGNGSVSIPWPASTTSSGILSYLLTLCGWSLDSRYILVGVHWIDPPRPEERLAIDASSGGSTRVQAGWPTRPESACAERDLR